MSRDIRNYFMVGGRKPAANTSKPQESPVKKRKATRISSDEDDSKIHKEMSKKATKMNKKRRIIESDDDEFGNEKPKGPNLKKLKDEVPPKVKKAVNVSSLFADAPKRIERKKATKINDSIDFTLNSDDEFEKSVLCLDESILIDNGGVHNVRSDKVEGLHKSPVKKPGKLKVLETSIEKVEFTKNSGTSTKQESLEEVQNKHSAETEFKKVATATKSMDKSLNDSIAANLSKTHDLNSSVISDEDRHEKKRIAAILYQKYKNREGALNPGCKEVPKGKPNCLAGLSFIVSGVLESLEREEAQSLIKELGGKISVTVGKKLNYLVVGQDAGPKKLAVAEELGIKQITEDQLFELIRERSITNEKSPRKSLMGKKRVKLDLKTDTSPSKRKASNDRETNYEKKRIRIDKDESRQEVKEENERIEPQETVIDCLLKNGTEAWVDKYKPTSIKQIIGQQGAASNCVKLKNWLSKWYTHHNGKKKPQRPNPWAKNDDGSFYRAALLSGPPGIGKTTTATLVSKELGFDIVEFNASDTRSKKLLKQEVSELLSNKSLYGYFHNETKSVSKKHVLIMDEVDGMAGNEDRGGIQELISLIKDTSIPIICMCNDRNHQKMRSLVNYCYDLRFNRPRLEQIKGAVMSICFKEKLKLQPGKIEEIISATNQDIRQTLNHLSLLSAGKELKLDEKTNNIAKKDLKLGPWDVVRKVFSAEEHKNMSLNDRSDLFFHDYSLGPLFVQQNYLSISPHVPKHQVITQVALAADALSLGDLVDKKIRSNSAWTLLPTQAMFSSVLPGEYMAGHLTAQIGFPAWLGKNSKRGKRSRLAQEIHDHTRIRTSGSRLSVRLDYAPFLLDAIIRPLKQGSEGVQEALNIIKEYHLLREDIDALIELSSWPGKKNPMDGIDSKVKAALTRAYNKEVPAYSYSANVGIKKRNAEVDPDLDILNEDEVEVAVTLSDEEEEDKLENDALIKTKKKPVQKASTSTATSSQKAISSKRGGSSSRGEKKAKK